MLTGILVLAGGFLSAAWPHGWGIAPLIAAVLIAACFLPKKSVVIIAIGTMLIRDAFGVFGWLTLVRVLAMLGVVGVVTLLKTRFRLGSLTLSLFTAMPVFQFIMTLGAWALKACGDFPLTPQGLAAALYGATPYFLNSLATQLFFTAAFVGLYAIAGAWVRNRWPYLIQRA